MNKIVGFIGCGNMAQAIIGGIVKNEIISSENIIVSAPSDRNLKKVKENFGIQGTLDNKDVASISDVLFLAAKPNKYKEVIEEIKECVKPEVLIVTIAAGISIDFVEKTFGRDIKVIRTMPNTPALVGEGMASITPNSLVPKDELDEIINVFNSFGKCEIVEEKLIDAVTAISGSSPAYVYMFIEALADGGVLGGLPRDKAYKFAAQAVLGAAKMVLETGENPGSLKDKVCSPAGTTIEAVRTLEKNNFRGTVIEAVNDCIEKSIKMGKKS
jgi:pyrroline-5-carboxylate reductase